MSSDATAIATTTSPAAPAATSTDSTDTNTIPTTTNDCLQDISLSAPSSLAESIQSSQSQQPLSCETHNNHDGFARNNITATSNSSSDCNDININSTKHDDSDTTDKAKTNSSYELKDETIYRLVDHSVGAIALDCGYQVAHQSSLDILTDVCCDYFKKISSLLRIAHDTEDWRDSESDFVDSLERVFHQINIPSAANLHQFICKMEAFKKHQQNA